MNESSTSKLNINDLVDAVCFQDYISVKHLTCFINSNQIGLQGLSPLQIASQQGDIKMMNILLDRGASPNYVGYTENSTPLYRACEFCQISAVQLLLKRGALLNNRSCKGEIALNAAVRTQNFKLVSYLIKCGSYINTVNAKHETTLSIAIQYGGQDFNTNGLKIIQLLKNNNAVL